MNNRIYNRVIDEAKYIIINDKTVRDASLVFGVSKVLYIMICDIDFL